MVALGTVMKRAASLASAVVLAGAAITLAGCEPLPWATSTPHGNVTMESIGCLCRYVYPASWFTTSDPYDPSKPQLGLHNYNTSSAAHIPVPARFADIGVAWHDDPGGALYRAATTGALAPADGRRVTVASLPAVSYARWTAPGAAGSLYEQHIYLYAPQNGRDYDLSLLTSVAPSRGTGGIHRVFAQLVQSFAISATGQAP